MATQALRQRTDCRRARLPGGAARLCRERSRAGAVRPEPALQQAAALRQPARERDGRRPQSRRPPRHRLGAVLVRGPRLRAAHVSPQPPGQGIPPRQQRARARRRQRRLARHHRRRLGRRRHLLVQEPGARRRRARSPVGDARAVGGAPARQHPRDDGDVRAARLRRRRHPGAALGELPGEGAAGGVAVHQGRRRAARAPAVRPGSGGRRPRLRLGRRQRRRPRGRAHRDRLVRTPGRRSVRRGVEAAHARRRCRIRAARSPSWT